MGTAHPALRMRRAPGGGRVCKRGAKGEVREQLAEFGAQLGGLSRRAAALVQLKPRSPETPLQGRPPLRAVCDYRQMEITVHKGEELALLSNAQPQRWRVAGAGGGEAAVPSVCFVLPPPNPEALGAAQRLEAAHAELLALGQRLHADLRALRAWHRVLRDVREIQGWTPQTGGGP
ncbi:LOW QUALITY PROTEIN: plectin-like [Opisthocomus hoazin]|uniref:LOW QUALITY PROTEIN: plectin-like n=1 Tax=Opisthocomus hoazin TaxID=30419 RepID=UPI003F53CD78